VTLPLGVGIAMPFSASFERHDFVERVRALRTDPIATYGIAICAVAVATGIRWLLGGWLLDGLPFITFYPAIIVATLIGGLWPGVLATILSSMAAWYLFLPAESNAPFSLLLYLVISGINVGLVTYLDIAIDRAMAQEQNVRVLIESAPNGVLVVDEGGRITLINASMQRLFGYEPAEVLGKDVEVLVGGRNEATHRLLRETFQRHPEARPMGVGRDLSGRRKDGSEFPVEIGLNPVERDGKRGVLATVIDISERKRAQERQRLVAREMQHRTKNMLAVIQSVANQSLIEGRSVADAKEELGGRLQALARAYTMLANSDWEGARLDDIIEQELAGFSNNASVIGCNLTLTASAAQQFALTIHELATNAAKYGALSVPEGRIAIVGDRKRLNGIEQLLFSWTESEGPAVSPPKRNGFGSSILLEAANQLGTAAVEYSPQGLIYTFVVLQSNRGTRKLG
jgi:PAS domain S-box-containing protein